MQLGIFAKTFARPTIEQTIDAVAEHGLECIQFNMTCAGLASMPEAIDPLICDRIRQAVAQRGITMSAVSGTYNMAHPDPVQRDQGLRRLNVLAQSCRRLGAGVITLCTGTRDSGNMWRYHPANQTPQAWRDMAASVEKALTVAEAHDVVLGVEPEVSNVVDSPASCRRLIDDMQSPRLKVIMDGANLFPAGTIGQMGRILTEAVDLLGPDIVLSHAKDLSHDGEAGDRAAGKGLLDYELYLSLLSGAGFDGPLLLHGLTEEEVCQSVRFVRRHLH